MSNIFLDKITEGLKNNELIVFCGAGISFKSGVPLVLEIKSQILEKLDLSDTEKKEILNYQFPFEAFIEILIENTNPSQLFELFDIGVPNTNHYFLAKLAKYGLLDTIVTTNFDSLVEEAMDQEGVKYQVVYKEYEFENIRWDDGEVNILKLHGSVHDKNNMAITIKNVANKELMTYRKHAIDSIFEHEKYKTIWVLGYSCSDIFDINLHIMNQKNRSKNILFIEHCQKSSKQFVLKTVCEKKEPNPFKDYTGYVLYAQTDDIIKKIWKTSLKESYKNTPYEKINWIAIIDRWIKQAVYENTEAIKNYIVGLLFHHIANYEKAKEYFFRSLYSNSIGKNLVLKISSYQAIGDTYRSIDETDNALEYLHKALSISKDDKFLEKQCRALLSIGVVYEDHKEHDKAIDYYQSALELARKINNKKQEAICIGNIGIVLKNKGGKNNLEEAIKCHKVSLEISIQIGDKHSEGRTLGNLGIAYSNLGDKKLAIEYYDKASEISNSLSDLRHQGIWMANAGIDYIDVNNELAQKYLQDAIELFQRLGTEHYVNYCKEKLSLLQGKIQQIAQTYCE